MAGPGLISVVGRKDTGKTTFLVALVREFRSRGLSVGVIKHGSRPDLVDSEGTDTWRHLNEAGADPVLLEAPGSRILFGAPGAEGAPADLALRYFSACDLVVTEGFKRYSLPKIEVYRADVPEDPLCVSRDTRGPWIALVSDQPVSDAPCTVFRIGDSETVTAVADRALRAAVEADSVASDIEMGR